MLEVHAGKSMKSAHVCEKTEAVLKLFESISLTPGIARRAGGLLRCYRGRGLTPLDSIIAATALESGAAVVTRNIKHFRSIEELVVFDLPTVER